MDSYQERVIEEHKELDLKITKLELFLQTEMYEKLLRTPKELLILQYAYMQNYRNILERRIALFN
jgi:hypothetical protein